MEQKAGGKILIMDDDDTIREVAERILIRLGYQVAGARNGSDAIELYKRGKAENRPFDAVVLDLTVPEGMGGQETLNRLREIDPSVKALVSSGYADDPVLTRYAEYGFVGAVSKPFSLKTFADAVRSAVAR